MLTSLLLRLRIGHHALRAITQTAARLQAFRTTARSRFISQRLPAKDQLLLRGWRAGLTRAMCVVLLVHFVGGPAAIVRACADDGCELDPDAPDCQSCDDPGDGGAGSNDPENTLGGGSGGSPDPSETLNSTGGMGVTDPGGADPVVGPTSEPPPPDEPPPAVDSYTVDPPTSPPDPTYDDPPVEPIPETSLPDPSTDTPPDNTPPEEPVAETPPDDSSAPVEEPVYDDSGAPPADDGGWCGGDGSAELASLLELPFALGGLVLADDAGSWDGINQFRVHDGNARRKISELKLRGTVSQLGLSWTRFNNTVEPPGRHHFGTAGNWRHSWQFDLVPLAPEKGNTAPRMTLVYPEGDRRTLARSADGTWTSPTGFPERATVVGGNVDIETGNGSHLFFAIQRRGDGKFRYNLQRVTDTHGEITRLDYDADGFLTKITEASTGRSLSLSYRQIASPRTERTIVARIAPKGGDVPASGQWVEVAVDKKYQATAWRYIRVRAHPTTDGLPIAEVQFFAPGSDTPLSGKVIGDIANAAFAFDGNRATVATGEKLAARGEQTDLRYVGLDLGAPTRVERIRVLTGSSAPFGECAVEGLAVAPASVRVLTQVKADDGRTVRYDYGVVSGKLSGVQDVALVRTRYGDGTKASYKYSYALPAGYRPAMVEAKDPRYTGRAKNIRYDYYPLRGEGYLGEIHREINPATGKAMVTREHDSYKDPLKRVVSYGDQRTVVYTLKAKGDPRPVSRRDELGRVDQWEYSGDRLQIAAHVHPNGRRVEIQRDERGRVLARSDQPKDQPKREHRIAREANGQVASETDRFGRTKQIIHEANGRVARIEHFNGAREEWTRDEHGRVLVHRDRDGTTRRFTYNTRGLIATATDATGVTLRYGYNRYDQLVRVTDAAGRVTRYLRNERGQIVTRINSDGTSRAYAFDDIGREVGETDELGRTTRRELDHLGRTLRVTDPAGNVTSYDYAELPNGCGACSMSDQPTNIRLPSGQQISQLFDSAGRLVTRTVAAGSSDAATTIYTYDNDNHVTSITDSKGRVSKFAYDIEGHMTSRADPVGRVTAFAYDSFDNLTRITAPDGRSHTLVYDASGRIAREADAAGRTTRYVYTVAGDLAVVIDAKGNRHWFNYDSQRRKTAMVYPDGSREKWTYDATGRLATYTTRAGQVKTNTYDGRGRSVKTAWSPAGAAPTTTYEYDAGSQLKAVDNGVARLAYTYDRLGHVLTETTKLSSSVANTSPQTLTVSYNAFGQRTALVYPDGATVRYGFDGQRRLTTVSLGGVSPLATYAYDVSGQPISITRENGVSTRYSYDDAGRLLGVAHTKGSEVLASSTYTLDVHGRRTTHAREDGANEHYQYDESGQLTGVDSDIGAAVGAQPARTMGYSYDAVGNLARMRDTSGKSAIGVDYTANALNQYTKVHDLGSGQPASLSYDQNGNLMAREIKTGSPDQRYRYNALNQLVAMETTAMRIENLHDPYGRCVVRKQSTPAQEGGWITSTAESRTLLYDGWSLVAERRLDGTTVVNYVHGARIDEILAMVAPSATSYPLHDGLGSAVALTDVRGAVTERYRYDPFGVPVVLDAGYKARISSAFGNRFLFTGREWLKELGIYEYRSRHYSPALARFTSPDAVRFLGGLNLYAYCGNQPVSLVDPYGTLGFGFCTYSGGDTWSKRFENCFQAMTGIQTSNPVGTIAGATAGVATTGSTIVTTYGAQSVSTVVTGIVTETSTAAAAAATTSAVDAGLVAGATVVKATAPIAGAVAASYIFGVALGCVGTATINPGG